MNDINFDDELYLGELQSQCRFALRAFSYAMVAVEEDFENFDSDEVWYHLQSFIVAVGNVSLMLKQRTKKECKRKYKVHHEELVKKFNLPDYYFSEERNIRNAFEHYDEQIIDWLEEKHNVRGLNNIGPIDNIIQGATFSYLKHLDNQSNTLYFKNMSIHLNKTYERLVELDNSIENMINFNHG